MPHLKITLAYDGTNYAGWQVQPEAHGPTVQGVVAAAIEKLTGERICPAAAGRTDAGVHARGQVISFTTSSRIPVERWPAALNSVLPEDIAALKAEAVPPNFTPATAPGGNGTAIASTIILYPTFSAAATAGRCVILWTLTPWQRPPVIS